MINKIDHIGIAVTDLDEAIKLYTVLGLKVAHTETVPEQKARTAMIPIGQSKIELLESTDPQGPIGKFIEKRGEGIHHISVEVADIRATLKTLKDQGIPLIDNEPRTGVGGAKIAFLHPSGTRKVLLELVEH